VPAGIGLFVKSILEEAGNNGGIQFRLLIHFPGQHAIVGLDSRFFRLEKVESHNLLF